MSARTLKQFGLFLSIFVAFSASASASVDISRKIYLPKIDGLEIQGEFPTEINRSNQGATFALQMSDDAAEALLSNAGLPPILDQIAISTKTPQCKVSLLNETQNYRIAANDREWLKSKGRWCRFKRKVFGGCKPDTLSDVISIAKVQAASPLNSSSTPAEITATPEAACMTESNDDAKLLNALRECAAFQIAGGRIDACMPAPQYASLELYQKIYRKDGIWSVELTPAAQTLQREILSPKIEYSMMERKIQALKIGAISLSKSGGTGWTASLGVQEALSVFEAAPQMLKISADFLTFRSGETPKAGTENGEISMRYETRAVANLPVAIVLSRADILGVEEVVETEQYASKANQVEQMCRWTPDSDKSEFGHFLCANIQMLSKQTQIRVRFADSQGIERYLTWEKVAPVSVCQTHIFHGITCELGRFENNWREWIADRGWELKSFLADPTYDDSARITFSEMLTFVPKAAGAPALTTFVTPQSRKFTIH